MSKQIKNPPVGGQGKVPAGATPVAGMQAAAALQAAPIPGLRAGFVLGGLGLGMGLLILAPGAAFAGGGHAEITLGFPRGAITVGRTWEDAPREVVVERVTHKLPETDYDGAVEGEDEDIAEADAIEEDYAPEEQVIIEKRRPRIARTVTIIERYEEPAYCERERVSVVRKVYVEPSCDRTEVVYRSSPQRVVYVPSRTVIVQSSRNVHPVRGHGGGHHVRGYNGGGHHDGAIRVRDSGPRNLFPEDGGRPMRSRGTQRNLVMVGGHPH